MIFSAIYKVLHFRSRFRRLSSLHSGPRILYSSHYKSLMSCNVIQRGRAALPAVGLPDFGDLAGMLGRGGALEGIGVHLGLDCEIVWVGAASVDDCDGDWQRRSRHAGLWWEGVWRGRAKAQRSLPRG
jgi:hypothetical protein